MKEIVWSVNIMLGIGMVGVAYVIYYILKEATDELNVSLQDKENSQSD
jgi:hypothetical protein